MRPKYEVGELVLVDGRYGRVVQDCGEFIVATSGDPVRKDGVMRMCSVVAVAEDRVRHVDE